MDVTRLSGALRAADGRAPTAREAGPGFESFLPDAGAAPRRDGERLARAERAERLAEQQRADAQRAEERRAEERRSQERRAAERRAEERRAEERRAEEAAAREAADEEEAAERAEARRAAKVREAAEALADAPQSARADAETPLGGPEQLHAEVRAPSPADPPAGVEPAGLARTPAPAAFAGAAGMQSLVQWLEGRSAVIEGPRAERALELAAQDGAGDTADSDGPPIAMADGVDGADAATDDDPSTELTRLLEFRRLASELLEPTARKSARPRGEPGVMPRVESRATPAQTGLGQHGLAGPGANPLTAARIIDAGAVARAGSTPTALPEGVDESSIMRQISDALRLRGDRPGRAQTAEIALHPAELGRVRIKIRMEAGAARVLVSAEHAAVGDLLGAGLDQLRRDLMAHGVQVAHLEVREGFADEGGAHREAPERDEAEDGEAPEVNLERPKPGARRARGRIDLEA